MNRYLNRKYLLLLLLQWMVCLHGEAQSNLIEKLVRKNASELSPILDRADDYEIQIIYTQIDRNRNNEPTFKTYQFRADASRYFYPASTVKLPIAVLALEKLNNLNIAGLNKHTPLVVEAPHSWQTHVEGDSTAPDGKASIAHYIKKILVASDNDAYNRLYEFLGRDYINATLHAKGYGNSRINHRLSLSLSNEQNKITNPIIFFDAEHKIFEQPEIVAKGDYQSTISLPKGKGYMQNGTLIETPFDFREKNFWSLRDQQELLKALFFPETVAPQHRFNLTPDDYQYLYRYLSQLPIETDYPESYAELDDNIGKLLLFGHTKRRMPRHIRSFNKAGEAYGYLTDNAYIVDFERGVEFLLSATIYCNSNGIMNDDRYDYETIGYPFLGKLGKVIFDYEMERKKRFPPDFDRIEVNYDR